MILKLLFALFLSITTSFGSLIINDKTHVYDDFSIEYYYDDSSKLSINEIKNKPFSTTLNNKFTQGYKYGNAWFKIEIENNSLSQSLVLYFSESIWSQFDLYYQQDDQWIIEKNGLNIPIDKRQIKNVNPTFEFDMQPGEKKTLYILGNTIASQLGEFKLYTHESFFDQSKINSTHWFITYAAILFAFALLNLYNLIMTKESIYFYYILYVMIYIVFSFMHSGVYMLLGFPAWIEGLHTIGQLTLLSLILFTVEFLELKSTYRRMTKVFYSLASVAFIIAIMLALNIPNVTFLSNIFFSAVLILIVYVAITVLKRGFDGAKYYLIALMLYLPAMTMMAMTFNTVAPYNDITRYSFLAGAFLEIFLFTLILTNRYKYISRLNNNLLQKTKELEMMKSELQKESTTDYLTGLFNRRHFVQMSEKYFESSKRYKKDLSVLMVDIDNFKQINDNYGHHIGDIVIQKVATVINKLVRTSDIAARYGGEEFIVLSPETHKEASGILAQRIRQTIEQQTITAENIEHKITVSIGLTQFEKEDKSMEEVIIRADKALYQVKNSGKNRVCSL